MFMKRFFGFVLVLVMLLALTACGNNEIRLGTSAFSIILPEGFAATDDDFDEDQIAYYYKDDNSIDFDVYQWEKEDGSTLRSEAEFYANEYNTVAQEIEINGIFGMKYVSLEEYAGETYTVVNYMFEDENSFVELCFWTDDSEGEYAAVEEIIQTLKMN